MFLLEDDLSSTTLICLLSTFLVTTWLLTGIYVFLERRCGRLYLNETHGADDIRIDDQDMSHHFDEVQGIDGCYPFLDRPAHETHYEDVNEETSSVVLCKLLQSYYITMLLVLWMLYYTL